MSCTYKCLVALRDSPPKNESFFHLLYTKRDIFVDNQLMVAIDFHSKTFCPYYRSQWLHCKKNNNRLFTLKNSMVTILYLIFLSSF